MAYSISYANHCGATVTLEVLRVHAVRLGLVRVVEDLETLDRTGERYANQSFDILSHACDVIRKAGVTVETLETETAAWNAATRCARCGYLSCGGRCSDQLAAERRRYIARGAGRS